MFKKTATLINFVEVEEHGAEMYIILTLGIKDWKKLAWYCYYKTLRIPTVRNVEVDISHIYTKPYLWQLVLQTNRKVNAKFPLTTSYL